MKQIRQRYIISSKIGLLAQNLLIRIQLALKTRYKNFALLSIGIAKPFDSAGVQLAIVAQRERATTYFFSLLSKLIAAAIGSNWKASMDAACSKIAFPAIFVGTR